MCSSPDPPKAAKPPPPLPPPMRERPSPASVITGQGAADPNRRGGYMANFQTSILGDTSVANLGGHGVGAQTIGGSLARRGSGGGSGSVQMLSTPAGVRSAGIKAAQNPEKTTTKLQDMNWENFYLQLPKGM